MLTINGEKVKVLEVCERCGKPNKVETYLFGKFRTIPYPCDCAEDEENTKRENEEERKKAMAADQLRLRCFENSIFRSATFDRDDRRDPKASDCSFTYAENFDDYRSEGIGILFQGAIGCGKTFLASCVANHLINSGRSCLFVNMIEMLYKLKYESLKECSELFKRLTTCDLLIIDDFISLNKCVKYSTNIYHLINYRYSRNFPIIITTNYDIDDSNFVVPDALVQGFTSRIISSCMPVIISGGNRRNRNLNITAKFKVINCKR